MMPNQMQPTGVDPAPMQPLDPTGPENPVLNAQMAQSVVAVVIAIIIAFRPGSITDDQRNALEGAVFVFWAVGMALYQSLKGTTRSLPQVVRIKDAAYGIGHGEGVASPALGAAPLVPPDLATVEAAAAARR